jgi:hypothetical protein
MITSANRNLRRTYAIATLPLKKPLHPSVFQRVKTDQYEATAGRKDPDGLGQRCLQCTQLVIDRYTQGLERARRRVDALTVPLPDRCLDGGHQLPRRGQGARTDNGPGNGARPSLLTKPKQKFLQFAA